MRKPEICAFKKAASLYFTLSTVVSSALVSHSAPCKSTMICLLKSLVHSRTGKPPVGFCTSAVQRLSDALATALRSPSPQSIQESGFIRWHSSIQVPRTKLSHRILSDRLKGPLRIDSPLSSIGLGWNFQEWMVLLRNACVKEFSHVYLTKPDLWLVL